MTSLRFLTALSFGTLLAACGGAPASPAAPEVPAPGPGGAAQGYAEPLSEETKAPTAAAEPATMDEAGPRSAAPSSAPPPAAPPSRASSPAAASRPGFAAGSKGDATAVAREAEIAGGAVARPSVAVESSVKAGEWDDNANYREFQRYLGGLGGLGLHRADVRDRQLVAVVDEGGKGVPGCLVTVRDAGGREVTLTTMASGRAILFPHAEGLAAGRLAARTACQGARASADLPIDRADAVTTLALGAPRRLPAVRGIDIAFVLDTTGSMSEEIEATKATVQKVALGLGQSDVRVRIGMVTFKDRTDGEVTRLFPMTTDVARFGRDVSGLEAGGGGDTPESVNEGLHTALTRLDWSQDAVAKVAFLIGDAPPHLDYPNDADYAVDMRAAAHRGIKLFTIAASGMDDLGQAVWRQIAQYTGGTNMFVLRGGAGPQSTGAGDPKSSCGGTQTAYTSGALDALILGKIRGEIRALDRDPLRIAGLGTDENAKPCSARLAIAGD